MVSTLVLSLWGFLPPVEAAGDRPELDLKPTLGAPLLIFHSPRLAVKSDRASPARLPVISLATRSHHVIFAYDQVIRSHRSYRPSGGLPKGGPPQVDLPAIVRCQRRRQRKRQEFKTVVSVYLLLLHYLWYILFILLCFSQTRR